MANSGEKDVIIDIRINTGEALDKIGALKVAHIACMIHTHNNAGQRLRQEANTDNPLQA